MSHRRFVAAAAADRIVSQLQSQQHLRPHQSVREAVDRAQADTGFCPRAAEQAITSLQLNASGKIGRLRGCELVQLGRTIYRVWQQAISAQPSAQTA